MSATGETLQHPPGRWTPPPAPTRCRRHRCDARCDRCAGRRRAAVARRHGLRVARQRGTTAHVAAIYPFHGGHALTSVAAPYHGINVTDGGSAWCYDPFELYGVDCGAGVTLTNSNTLVIGEPGNGKSAFPKMVVWREAGFYGNRRFAAISDPKGEYGALADALGMARVRLSPGGRQRLNPLDPGPGDPELALLARQTLLAGMLGSVLRRDLTVVEESLLAIAVERLDAAHRGGQPAVLPDLARILGDLPDELARHEHLSLLSPQARSEALTALRVALVKLLEHTLRGMFDGQSTVHVDWASGPGLVVDYSSVFDNPDALPLVQMTTNHWLWAQMAALKASGPPRHPGRGRGVGDGGVGTVGSDTGGPHEAVPPVGHLEHLGDPPPVGPALAGR